MKLTEYLNEEKTKETNSIQNKIKDFFRKNPNPADKQVHAYAESLGIDEHDFEEHIYKLLSNYVKKDNVSEQTQLNEIFIEESQDDIESLRLSIIAELDASNFYERMAKKTSNTDVKKVLLDISKEEKIHAGEFKTLLDRLDPAHAKAETEGEKEVNNLLKGE